MNVGVADNLTDISQLNSNISLPRIILIVLALTLGVPGIIANIIVAYIKARYQSDYDSPTYSYMIQLAVADVFALICISLGTVIFILFPNIYESHPDLENWFAFALNLGWHPGCCFFCFIAYSRFITLCKNDLLSIYFSKRRVRISICSSWLIFGGIYSLQFLHREHFGRMTRWFPDKLSWGDDIEYGVSGKIFLTITMSLSFGTFGFIGYYDLKILNWLRKNRQSIKTIDNSRMLKHEVKLFLQCLFTGCCLMGVIGTYMLLNIFIPNSSRSLWCYLLMDVSWLLNHSINPLIYSILNKKLRQHVYLLVKCKQITAASSTTCDVIVDLAKKRKK